MLLTTQSISDARDCRQGMRLPAALGIVLLAHTNFDSPFVVGSHHLRRILGATPGIQLLAIEPFSGWRVPRKGSERGLLRPKLWLPLRASAPALRERILAVNSQLLRFSLRQVVRDFPAARCVILDNPYSVDVALWLQTQGFRLITRVTDWMPGQIPSPDRETNFRMLRRALAAADRIIVTSRPLARYVQLLSGKQAHVITNGVDDRLLTQAVKPGPTKANRVIYYGAFDKRIDALALREVARTLPEMHFDIFTPSAIAHQAESWSNNVHFCPPVAYDALASVLGHYAFALLPFSNLASNHSRFPMKLFELLGCGVQVVAPPLGSLVACGPVPGLHLSPGFGSGPLALTLRGAQNEWLQAGLGTRADLQGAMRARARSEGWESKVAQILDLCRFPS